MEKKKKKIIIGVVLAAIAVPILLIIFRVRSANVVDGADYVGQWTDKANGYASLDIWDVGNGTYIGMSSFQLDEMSAAFLDFEAKEAAGGLKITSCSRMDVVYTADGSSSETTPYEDAEGMIRKNGDGTLSLSVKGDADTKAFTFALEGAY